jgi:hypothetical protein
MDDPDRIDLKYSTIRDQGVLKSDLGSRRMIMPQWQPTLSTTSVTISRDAILQATEESSSEQ